MGKRGPPPTPTALRIVRGDRKDRINTSEPMPAQREVRCPEWLSGGAQEVWTRLAPDLVAKGVLTAWDVDAFARVCVLITLNRQALEDVLARGVLVRGDHGIKVKNPALQVARDTGAELTTLGGRFGLTPADRTHLKVGDGSTKDDKERLLS